MPVTLPIEAETIRRYSTWFMIYGGVLIVLGAIAIVAPGLATLAVGVTIGWLLLVSGVLGLIAVFWAGFTAPGFWWNLLSAVLFLLAGMAVLWDPAAGAVTLTVILVVYLFATGIFKIMTAFGYRQTIPTAWAWVLLSALIDILLGIVILAGMPFTALWVLGLLVGINLVSTGVALVIAAVQSRKVATIGASPRTA